MSETTPTPTAPTPTTQTRKRHQMSNQPTALEIVRNIENGNRAQAAAWHDAAATVIRTLNAGQS